MASVAGRSEAGASAVALAALELERVLPGAVQVPLAATLDYCSTSNRFETPKIAWLFSCGRCRSWKLTKSTGSLAGKSSQSGASEKSTTPLRPLHTKFTDCNLSIKALSILIVRPDVCKQRAFNDC